MAINSTISCRDLTLFLNYFDPGNHSENFYYEAKHMVEENCNLTECISILKKSVGYNVGDCPEFDSMFSELFDQTFSNDLDHLLEQIRGIEDSDEEDCPIDWINLMWWLREVVVDWENKKDEIEESIHSKELFSSKKLLPFLVSSGYYVIGENPEFEEILKTVFGEYERKL